MSTSRFDTRASSDDALPPQGNRYRMTLGFFHVARLDVVGGNPDRDLFALWGIDDGQAIKFDFGHHALVLKPNLGFTI